MQIHTTLREELAILSLSGPFDFHAHRDFRQTCDALLDSSSVKTLELDLGRVDYLDSSALGMLLILKDKAGEKGKEVVLSGPRGTVRQVLEIANFGKLFTLRD